MKLSPFWGILVRLFVTGLILPNVYSRLFSTSTLLMNKAEESEYPVEPPVPEKTAVETKSQPDSTSTQVRIVGGSQADEGEYPWFVSPSSGVALCGASLIHSSVVLTAAHCASIFDVGAGVYVGTHRLQKKTKGTVFRTVRQQHFHPQYRSNAFANDYMLLQLSSPVTTITPVQLNKRDSVPATGESLTAIGFGLLAEEGSISFTLQHVDLFAVDDDECKRQYRDVITPAGTSAGVDEQVMFCAGFPDGGKGTCNGDSGGPLVTANGTKQVGIVSVGVGCADANYAGVYARISGAIDFIEQGICELSPSSQRPKSCPPTDASGPTSRIRLVVGYDFWTFETHFTFLQNGKMVYMGPKYLPYPFDVWSTEFDDFATGPTIFRIFDSACDGWTSPYGYFEIYRVVVADGVNNATEILLASGDHDFTCNTTVRFTV